RCALLEPPVREALDAGRLQARGALARGGAAIVDIDALEAASAAQIADFACDAPEVLAEAARATDAFIAWRAMQNMDFPAWRSGWRAAKGDVFETAWLVRQDVAWGVDGRAIVGLANTARAPSLTLYVDGGATPPRAARLLVRDQDRAAEPVDMDLARLIAGPGVDELALRAVPDAFARRHWASDRETGAVVEELAGGAPGPAAVAFFFAPETLEDFAALDPRETVFAEIDRPGPGGALTTTRLLIEVGDFHAARLFAAPRETGSAEP
ncbi:MAG: hypothetical protein MI723_17765, partial [Caulobacterales bacterium]|nr:hypothetical protein [Caulobacterales bacterium]